MCFNRIKMLNSQDFLDGMQSPITSFSRKQLKEREEFWRAIWGWVDEDVKYFVLRVGQLARIMRRDYKGSVGELGQVKFEPKEIELAVYEKTYNYQDGKYYYERKVVKMNFASIAWCEFISEQTEAEEVEKYEVAPLEETAEVV